jgi:predicted transposase YbfD/YdcC
MSATGTIAIHFKSLEDPRAEYRIEHQLMDMLIITICATICGANDWEAVAEYGRAKQEWLSTFLELPNGIPSHDTFNRLFARLNPEQMQSCFINWVEEVHQTTAGELLNVDGKTLRGAVEPGSAKSLIHMVSVWSSEHRLVLGQQKVDEKSNEITAIPKLLELLMIEGCLVSMDAMGCQKHIAQTIIAQRADYVLALKGNQGDLHQDVVQLFAAASKCNFQGIEHQFHSTTNRGHGRVEVRRYYQMGNTEYLLGAEQWAGLKSIGMVESERHINGNISSERRYYLLSIENDVHRFADAVRHHWSIENQLHWVLDVGFEEDSVRTCVGHSAENLAVIRQMGLNLLSQDRTTKVGMKTKRLKAGWNDDYLKQILTCSFAPYP